MTLRSSLLRRLSSILLCSLAGLAPAVAQDFAGKTIEIIVPYDTGGVTDLEARAFQRVLPEHMPGRPTVIVRNMPGGGGLIGVNWLGEIARPDGTQILIWTWSPIMHLLKEPSLRIQLSDLVPVGGLYFGDVAFMRGDTKPEYKEPADFLRTEKIWFGGLGPTNHKDIIGRLQLDLLGANYGYISSFRGQQDLVLAIQKGELQFTTASTSAWKTQIGPSIGAQGIVRPLYQGGRMLAGATSTVREPVLQDLPTYEEFYRAVHGKEPSGEKWTMYSTIRNLRGAFSDAVLLPPKTPAPIAKVIQAAFDKSVADRGFIAEYQKLAATTPQWVDGPGAEKVLERLRNTDPSVSKFLTEFVEQVKK